MCLSRFAHPCPKGSHTHAIIHSSGCDSFETQLFLALRSRRRCCGVMVVFYRSQLSVVDFQWTIEYKRRRIVIHSPQDPWTISSIIHSLTVIKWPSLVSAPSLQPRFYFEYIKESDTDHIHMLGILYLANLSQGSTNRMHIRLGKEPLKQLACMRDT